MPAPLSSPSREDIDFFHENSYIQYPAFFTGEEIRTLRAAIDAAIAAKRERIRRAAKGGRHSAEYERIFNQRVNLWTDYAALKLFTFNVRLAATARALSQCRHVRLYHDHAWSNQLARSVARQTGTRMPRTGLWIRWDRSRPGSPWTT